MLITPAAALIARMPATYRSTPRRPRNRELAALREAAAGEIVTVPVEAAVPAEPVDKASSPAEPTLIVPFVPIPSGRAPQRLLASAWLIARPGKGEPSAGGLLGGSQVGVRGMFMLDRSHRIAVSARVSAPLSGQGREAALGLDWQPLPSPVHLVAERRFPLDGGRGGNALYVVGGFGPRQIAPHIRAEAYAQIGAIAADDIERFADGAARVSYDLGSVGGVDLDAGAGAWSAAQRGAARLDLGPSLGVRLPITGQAIHLTLDWRQRVAGAARPGSGAALSIGSDF